MYFLSGRICIRLYHDYPTVPLSNLLLSLNISQCLHAPVDCTSTTNSLSGMQLHTPTLNACSVIQYHCRRYSTNVTVSSQMCKQFLLKCKQLYANKRSLALRSSNMSLTWILSHSWYSSSLNPAAILLGGNHRMTV